MIRPVTLVTFLAFIGSGLYLYQVKHQAQLVDRQIRKVQDATDAARARAQVLRAEYALLNDPNRLAELAAAYVTDLKPTQPGQWSSMAEIDRRLPPVGEPTAAPQPLEPDAPNAAEPTPVATRADPPRAEPPRPQPRPPVAVATAEPAASEPVAPARPAAAVAAKPMPRPAPRAQPAVTVLAQTPHGPAARPAEPVRAVAVAQPEPAPVQVAAEPLPPPRPTTATAPARSLLPRVSPPTPPAGASVLAIAARPAARQDAYGAPPATTAEAVARVARGAPVDPTVPAVASALGMARTMLSMTPVSPAAAGMLYPQGTTR